jgi:hypothetical protein
VTLLLNVLHHHLVGHVTRTGRKVASRPKVPPPKLTAQRLELHQHLARCPSLDGLDQIADRNVRRYRYENVYVIPGDVPLENLNIFGLTDFSHQLPHPRGYFACQNWLAVFGDPYQMKFQIVNGVARSTVMFHTASLLKSSPEGEGFSPNPRWGQ